jgi:hypothetical protein
VSKFLAEKIPHYGQLPALPVREQWKGPALALRIAGSARAVEGSPPF